MAPGFPAWEAVDEPSSHMEEPDCRHPKAHGNLRRHSWFPKRLYDSTKRVNLCAPGPWQNTASSSAQTYCYAAEG